MLTERIRGPALPSALFFHAERLITYCLRRGFTQLRGIDWHHLSQSWVLGFPHVFRSIPQVLLDFSGHAPGVSEGPFRILPLSLVL